MTVTAPITTARLALIQLLENEFATEQYPVKGSHLHKSLGRDGKTRIGVSPVTEAPGQNQLVMQATLLVQFYGPWKDIVDPNYQIDATDIETKAERFKRALHGHDPDTNNVWYFSLLEIQYPHDPIGQNSRFEARVRAFGNNTSLIETTG
jgi:hypothetical protein